MSGLRSIVTLFCLTSVTVLALPPVDEIQADFIRLDLNSNQGISSAEWDQHAFALFQKADRNGNQKLEAAELSFDSETEHIFARADLDQDGALSVDEFMRLRRSLFKAADINAGDFINAVEYTLFRLLEITGWKDRNHDNRVSFSELRDSLQQIHRVADLDGNGELSRQEAVFLTAEEYQLATDNGPLTPEALTALYRFHLTGE